MTISRRQMLLEAASNRILVTDGAMGTMIQTYGLTEADYRGEQFAQWPKDLKGNSDLLALTRPDIIREIADQFLEAGADILGTNSFSGTTIAQADYGLEEYVRDINKAAARIAREAADAMTEKTPDKPRFVAGSIGPTNRTLSVSPDVNNPGHREVTFDEVKAAYREQAEALLEGGADFLLIETIFDSLNAKAAAMAVLEMEEVKGPVPLMISFTVTDMSGRNLSGQTVEAFWHSIRHAEPLTIGLNCAFGAEELRPHVATIARLADTLVMVYPNAGLPNEMGEYDQSPEIMAGQIGPWAEEGLVNIVGGCCGSTPDHIAAIAKAVDGHAPRAIPHQQPALRLSGMDPFILSDVEAAE